MVLGPTGWLIQRALGLAPSTGFQIWLTLLLNFSLPTWSYFGIADASGSGATLGKRWLGLRALRLDGGRMGWGRALYRTAVKLLPWELAHIAAFALATRADDLSVVQIVGLSVANALMLGYLGCAVLTRGRRSVHDFAAGTIVEKTIRIGEGPVKGREAA